MSVRSVSRVLPGEHVRLRWWESRDDVVQRSWPYYDDPCNALWNIPRSMSFYDSLFGSYSAFAHIRRVWAIENERGTLIGRISLREIDQSKKQARLGISMGAPYLGQGYGTEALALFLDYFFGEFGFACMVLDVAAFNRRAVRCYERLGFRCIADEWRKTASESAFRALTDPRCQDLRAYFRYDRACVWVQFLEMELTGDEWQVHPLAGADRSSDVRH